MGKVVGVFGVDGRVKIHSYTRERADIFKYGQWIVGPGTNFLTLEQGVEQGRGLVAKLAGLDDRDSAAARIGELIHVTEDQLPVLEKNEYFWHQLEGLEAETLEGTPLGTVQYLFETGANDVLVVAGERERLIPFTDEVVRQVDLDNGVIRLDWDAEF